MVAEAIATEWVELLVAKPEATICLASGNSPKLACEAFVRLAKERQLDTSRFFFIGLDEWIGVPPDKRGSCRWDFEERIFRPLAIGESQIHLFNGLSNDLSAECIQMDEVITSRGGIDLMMVGIGMNGHIGFNEPGTEFSLKSHVIRLDPVTASVGQQYFDQPMSLDSGITLGPAHILATRRLILVAQGAAKADVIRQAVEGPVGPSFPASMIQLHSNATVFADAAAGQLLAKK
jgi:glucosamine-6-phosphate isomerase